MSKKSNARRKDGRISVQVYLGSDPVTKKRRYKTVYGATQKEADEQAEALKLAKRKGIDVTPELVTFAQWADKWLSLKKIEVCAKQGEVYASCIKHLKDAFGGVDIVKVRPADVQDILLSLAICNPNTKKPAKKRTLSAVKSTAGQIFQLAIDNRLMDYNPATSTKIPAKDEPRSVRALTEDEQRWITDTSHRAQLAAMIMMYSGLRRGELISLMWKDIDLKTGIITVNKAVEIVGSKVVLKDFTKTPSSIRAVNIPDCLIEYLKEQKRQSIYVCVSAKGEMHTASSWRRMWQSYLADLNLAHGDFGPFSIKPKSKYTPSGVPFVIPKINPHWLRHTFCTMLYFAGVDILTAKSQMGHKDIQTTLEIYTHLDALHKRKEIDKLNTFLQGKNKSASQMQVSSK